MSRDLDGLGVGRIGEPCQELDRGRVRANLRFQDRVSGRVFGSLSQTLFSRPGAVAGSGWCAPFRVSRIRISDYMVCPGSSGIRIAPIGKI